MQITLRLHEACTSGRATAEGIVCAMDGDPFLLSDPAVNLLYSADPFGWNR